MLKNQIEGQKKIEEKEKEIFNFKQLEEAKNVYYNHINTKINNINSEISRISRINLFKIKQLED